MKHTNKQIDKWYEEILGIHQECQHPLGARTLLSPSEQQGVVETYV
jgi:hypothetical protein